LINLEGNPLFTSLWLVWLTPIVGGILVPLVAKIGSKVRDLFSILVGFLSFLISLSLLTQLKFGGGSDVLVSSVVWVPSLDFEFGVLLDPLSCLFALLISFVGTLVLIYSLGYMEGEEGLTRYYSLMLLFIGAMIGLVMADNFLQLFIFWEIVGFCSFSLVGFWYKKHKAVKAATQVFLMTRIGDVSLLVAIILLYVSSGSLNILEVAGRVGSIPSSILTVSSLLLLFGAIAKSAQLPLHTWLFAAMEAPTTVSCLLHSATMVKAGVYLLARTHGLFAGVGVWLSSMMWIGLMTAFVAATLALSTTDIKGVAAYSTISQIGYMLAGLGGSAVPYSMGWFASIYHLVNHSFFQGLGFLCAGIIVHQLGSRDLRRMGGLRHDMPATFSVALVAFLSRAGLPPFCGFYSKELIGGTLWSNGSIPLILLFYSASALTVAYSLRLIILVYCGRKSEYVQHLHLHRASQVMILPAIVFAVLCGVLGPLQDSLIWFMGLSLPKEHLQLLTPASLSYVLSLLAGITPVYLFYLKGFPSPALLRGGVMIPIVKLLNNGYYFDRFYEDVVVRGFLSFSGFTNNSLEAFLCNSFPYLIAKGVMSGAVQVRRVAEEGLDRLTYSIAMGTMGGARWVREEVDRGLDRLCYAIGERTVEEGRRLSRSHTGLLPHFVLAAVLGILLLSALALTISYWGS